MTVEQRQVKFGPAMAIVLCCIVCIGELFALYMIVLSIYLCGKTLRSNKTNKIAAMIQNLASPISGRLRMAASSNKSLESQSNRHIAQSIRRSMARRSSGMHRLQSHASKHDGVSPPVSRQEVSSISNMPSKSDSVSGREKVARVGLPSNSANSRQQLNIKKVYTSTLNTDAQQSDRPLVKNHATKPNAKLINANTISTISQSASKSARSLKVSSQERKGHRRMTNKGPSNNQHFSSVNRDDKIQGKKSLNLLRGLLLSAPMINIVEEVDPQREETPKIFFLASKLDKRKMAQNFIRATEGSLPDQQTTKKTLPGSQY